MTNYAQQQWQPAPPVFVPRRGTKLSRWSVFLGIQSLLLGGLLPIPILAIVFGIVLGWSGLTFWGGFIALCVWSWSTSRI